METKTKLKPVRVVLEGRSTGMGAYTKHHLYSLRQEKELDPQRTEESKTGNHWEDIYLLLPGRYLIATQDISNSGKHNCGYQHLHVADGGYSILPWDVEIPDFICPPCDCVGEMKGES